MAGSHPRQRSEEVSDWRARPLETEGTPRVIVWGDSGVLASAWARDGGSDHVVWYDPELNAATSVDVGGSVKSLSWLRDGRLLIVGEDLVAEGWMAAKIDDSGVTEGIMLPESVVQVSSVDVSADGRAALGCRSTRDTGLLVVVDVETGLVSEQVDMEAGAITSVAWSSRGLIAAGYRDRVDGSNVLTVWYGRRGMPIAQFVSLSQHAELTAVWSGRDELAWGRREVDGQGNELAVVSTWNPNADGRARTLARFSGSVESLAWSPSGELAAGGWQADSGQGVAVWGSRRRPAIAPVTGHRVVQVAWSRDGRLAVAGPDGELAIWHR